VNIATSSFPPFSLQPFVGKNYHVGLNRLLTDSKNFKKSEKGELGGKAGNPGAGEESGELAGTNGE